MLDTLSEDIVVAPVPVCITAEQLPLIERVIQEVRPRIQADGGEIELGAIAGDTIRVRLSGACLHCSMAGQTLGGIRRRLVAELGVPVRVLPALD